MKIRFLGAAGEVTGSNYCIECGGLYFFVDCGIHQGRNEDEKNREELSINPGDLHSIFLTHAHMDHSGRIPYLVKNGFKGKIWATPATVDLVEVLWRDSAHLMKEEADWKNKKQSRRGLPPVMPLYDDKDVDNALQLLQPVPWGIKTVAAEGVEFTFYNAGHILGSSSISLSLKEGDSETRIVFSGDLGQQDSILDKAPDTIKEADYVLIESTYGDRLHRDAEATRAEFRDVILTALKDRGKVLIPSFVVDRAQRLLLELSLMQLEGILPEIPIYFDSPMGVRATEFYQRHSYTLSDEVQKIINAGLDPFKPRGLQYVTSPEASQKINDIPFCIVIAGSGMCTGGRIIHHLKHGAWSPKNHIIFVGYQAYGTLGRRIVDGETNLRIAGEDVAVKAKVHTIGGFSAHADRDDLMLWAKNYTTSPLFFVVHGEPKSSKALSDLLQVEGMRSIVPKKGQEFSISEIPALQPRIRPVSPTLTMEDKKVLDAMDDIRKLLDTLSKSSADKNRMDSIMPILVSARMLLEVAEEKVKH